MEKVSDVLLPKTEEQPHKEFGSIHPGYQVKFVQMIVLSVIPALCGLADMTPSTLITGFYCCRVMLVNLFYTPCFAEHSVNNGDHTVLLTS